MQVSSIEIPFPYSQPITRCDGLHISEQINNMLTTLGIIKEYQINDSVRKLFEIGYSWEKTVEPELQRFGVCRQGEVVSKIDLTPFVCDKCKYPSSYQLARYDVKEGINIHQCPYCMEVQPHPEDEVVYGSPDGIQHLFKTIWEYKVTSKSSNKHPMDDHKWRMQAMSYCAMVGYNTVIHYDFHIMGNYSRPWRVDVKPYKIEFTNTEIESNWNTLFREKL